MSGVRWYLGKGLHLNSTLQVGSSVFTKVGYARCSAPKRSPVANDFLHSAGLSPDEIDLVRKLVGHTIAAVECGLICRRAPKATNSAV